MFLLWALFGRLLLVYPGSLRSCGHCLAVSCWCTQGECVPVMGAVWLSLVGVSREHLFLAVSFSGAFIDVWKGLRLNREENCAPVCDNAH